MNASTPPSAAASPSPANIQLMQLTNAYWTSRCLHMVADLGVADALGDQPQSTEALAKATGTLPQALYRVLRLLASVGIFEWKHGTWHQNRGIELPSVQPSRISAGLRPDDRSAGVLGCVWGSGSFVAHGGICVRKAPAGGVFEYLAKHAEERRIFDAAMTSKSHRDIAAILPAYDFSQFWTIADIAGGRGHLLRAILKNSPKTKGILFDQLHVVAEVAPENGEKLTVVGGNFFADPMPKADAYLLMNMIHD